MPTMAKSFVTVMMALGVGCLAWAFSGVAFDDVPLIQNGFTVIMNAHGAFGIGAGCLAGAVTAIFLFKDGGWRKPDPLA